MAEEQLSVAIYQTIDCLSFMQTHEVDTDCHVHAKTTANTLKLIQAEQRKRIEEEFGPRPPSLDFIATQIMATYRGEAASVQLAKESGDPKYPTAIETMTDVQCRAFKKEMKQRIHEWEGAVQAATGQPEASPQQKAMLRSIYELYKVVRNRVVMLDSQQPRQAHAKSRRTSTGSVDNTYETSHSLPPSHRRNLLGGESPVTAGEPFFLQYEDAGSVEDTLSSNTHVQSSTTKSVARTSAPHNTGRLTCPSGSQPSTAPTSTSTPSAPIRGENIILPRVRLGTMPPELMTTADLRVEKRSIKQVLYNFEAEFQYLHGEPPNRQDRRNYSAEYHRYSALKDELARRTAPT